MTPSNDRQPAPDEGRRFFGEELQDPRAREFFAGIPAHLQPPEDPESPPARILDAARELFGEKGFEGASTREIAERARVNQAMIHYYFSNKRELYKRVIVTQMLALFKTFFLFGEEGAPMDEMLTSFPIRVMSLMRRRPDFRKLMLREFAEGTGTIRELVGELGLRGPIGFRRMLTERYEEGKQRGEVADLPTDHVLQFIISIAYSYVFLESFFPLVIEEYDPTDDAEWERRSESFRRILLHGLSTREEA